MKWDALVKLGCELPEVEEATWYRTPSLKVRGKGFVRLKEDGESVVFLLESLEEQEALLEARSDIYFLTDHYRGYRAILARLSKLRTTEARVRLEHAWRTKAPKTLIRNWDQR